MLPIVYVADIVSQVDAYPLPFYDAILYIYKFLTERKCIYQPFMASAFWFMHRKASLFKDDKNTQTCFFYYFCGYFLHQTAPFLKIILEQSKRPRLEVGHQGVVFQHPGVNTGVPLQQLMPTVQGKTQHQNQLSSSEKGVQRGLREAAPGWTCAVQVAYPGGFCRWDVPLSPT